MKQIKYGHKRREQMTHTTEDWHYWTLWNRLPQTSLHGLNKTGQGKLKCSCGHNKTTRHSWPWHVDLIHGARDCGSRWAWVSGDPASGHWVSGGPAGIESEAGIETEAMPAGIGQRRSGGHWSAAIRWRNLPRTARLGEPRTAAWSPANGGLGVPRTAAWTPANGRLDVSGGVGSRGRRCDLPRSAGWRARGQRTRGDHAELPRPLDAG